jgi:hypothetical protein
MVPLHWPCGTMSISHWSKSEGKQLLSTESRADVSYSQPTLTAAGGGGASQQSGPHSIHYPLLLAIAPG